MEKLGTLRAGLRGDRPAEIGKVKVAETGKPPRRSTTRATSQRFK